MNKQNLIDAIINPDNFRIELSITFIVLGLIYLVYIWSKERKTKLNKREHKRILLWLLIVVFVIITNLYIILFIPWNTSNISANFTIITIWIFSLIDGLYSIYYRNEINNYIDYQFWKTSIICAIIILIYYLALPFRLVILKFFWLE